jgi:hypothetical protein
MAFLQPIQKNVGVVKNMKHFDRWEKINRQVMYTLNSPAWRLAHFTSLSLGYLCETHAYSLYRLLLCDQSSISLTWYEQFSLPLDHGGPDTELTLMHRSWLHSNESIMLTSVKVTFLRPFSFKTNSTFTPMMSSTWNTSCFDHIIVIRNCSKS